MEEINANEYIKDPDFYNHIIKLKYDSDESIRIAANVAEVTRDNLILINKTDMQTIMGLITIPQTIQYTLLMRRMLKKPRNKRLSDELKDDNDDFMDDIIAGLRK